MVQNVTVVAPTEHLKRQWADAAHRVGISLNPGFRNADGGASADYTGVAVTYAGVAAHPMLHRRRTENRRTLVILDEIHHAGDALSWGEAVSEAFEPAVRRLALTGTPFRSDANPIPFVTYAPGPDGTVRSAADYTYGYAHALRDGVVRPVIFLSYSGQMRWRTRAGDEVGATLGEPLTKDLIAHAWRTALDPQGDWIPQVLSAADRRLHEVRRAIPDAGGLVIASDQAAARAYARILRGISGEAPTVVVSDEPKASAKIKDFAESGKRWMVAVRMVSEGVDVPRLAVGVYATSVGTPLFFAQAVGRFVRARRRGETASVFLPSIPLLLQFANEMEVERDHVLGRPPSDDEEGDLFAPEDATVAAANRAATETGLGDGTFEALEAGGAVVAAHQADQGDDADRGRRRERGGDPPGRACAAQGAQRAGRRVAPPHGRPARGRARRAAAGLRRAAGRPGDGRAAAGPHRPAAHVGTPPALTGAGPGESGRVLGGAVRVGRLLDRVVDREGLVQAGQRQDLADGSGRPGDPEGATGQVGATLDREQHLEAGRVHERDAGEVENHVRRRVAHRIQGVVAELRGRVQVDLAADRDDGQVVDLVSGQDEIHERVLRWRGRGRPWLDRPTGLILGTFRTGRDVQGCPSVGPYAV